MGLPPLYAVAKITSCADSIRVDTLKIGPLELESPVLLAPLAGYTDLPFRRCIRALGGCGMAYTELLSPKTLIHSNSDVKRKLVATAPDDQPLGYQVYGKEPGLVAAGAKWVEDYGAKLVDINMGCPQKKLSNKGRGAGLLRTPELAVEIVREVIEAVHVPVTVKLRLGWDNTDTAVGLAREFEKLGAAAITIHGRTRMQGFSGNVNLDAIRQVVEAVENVPVIANGDITSVESAREMFDKTGCEGIMLGRYPMKDPWIIRDIARNLAGEPPLSRPTRQERVDFMTRHFELSVEFYGAKTAVIIFRKWVRQYLRGLQVDRKLLAELMQITDPQEWRFRVPKALLELREGGN